MNHAGIAALFKDGKAHDAMRTIGEVSAALRIKPHVLRYWEQQFTMLRPLTRAGNRRLYRPDDIVLIAEIDRLIRKEGYTLKGARALLAKRTRESGAKPVSAGREADAAPSVDAKVVIANLRAIRLQLASALAA